MKRCLLTPLFAAVFLAQCNRAPETKTPTTAEPARPAVELVTAGVSPHFLAVASRLEVGGAAFSYLETDASTDLLSAIMEQIMEAMPAEDKAQMPPNFSFKKIMDLFGLGSIKAAGSSSRALNGGRHHARSFAYAPGGRGGLLSLTGGPAEKLLTRQFAAQDTDLALEFPLRLKDWFAEAWGTLIEMAPEEQRQIIEANASEKLPVINLSARELAEQLDLRLALLATLHPEQPIALPGAPMPLHGIDAALVIERLGPLKDVIKEQLGVLPGGADGPFEISEQDGILSVRAREPVMPPPTDFQPVLQLHDAEDRLIVATRPAYLDALLAADGKLTQQPEFAEAWTGLPDEGNGCLFVSKRFMTALVDGIKQAVQSKSGPGDEAFGKAILGVIDTLGKDLTHPQAFAYANEKDGILAAANSSLPAQMNSMSGISTLAIIASIAAPAFSATQDKANQIKAISAARQVGMALKAYAADKGGRYPAELSELITEDIIQDETLLFYQDDRSGESLPWLYNRTLTDDSPASSILLAAPVPHRAPTGKQTRLVALNDLSASMIPEEEFQQQKDDNLR